MSGAGTTKSTVVVGKWKGSGMTEPGPLATDTRLLGSNHSGTSGRRPLVADSLTPRPPDDQPPRRNLRDRWEREVWTTSTITDGCRVLLLAMARHMDHRGYVSVPRPQLAAEIGRNERRVGERIEQAVEAHYLSRVKRGQKGVTSVYRASIPDPFSRLGDSPLNSQQAANPPAEMGAAVQPADGAFSRPPGGPASSKAHPGTRTSAQQEPGQLPSELLNEEVEVERGTAPKVSLRLVEAQECEHFDPHPELCARCEATRRRRSA